MPIINEEAWKVYQSNNTDAYGKACVDVARRVMELLDNHPENSPDYDCHEFIIRADLDVGAGGITGFMAGCAAQMISERHSRGAEFRSKWNYQLAGETGNLVTQSGHTINPAIIMVSKKEGE